MRTRYSFAFSLLLTAPALAQPVPGSCELGRAQADLNVSDVQARLFNTGSLFFGNESQAAYLVPWKDHLVAEDVLNTRTLTELRAWIAERRARYRRHGRVRRGVCPVVVVRVRIGDLRRRECGQKRQGAGGGSECGHGCSRRLASPTLGNKRRPGPAGLPRRYRRARTTPSAPLTSSGPWDRTPARSSPARPASSRRLRLPRRRAFAEVRSPDPGRRGRIPIASGCPR